MLGLGKAPFNRMVFLRSFIGSLTLTAGLGLGALFDKLIFALLLKLMKMKVEPVDFPPTNCLYPSFIVFGVIFPRV